MPRKRVSKNKKVALPVLNPDAAGIDIGATEIYVAVPADRDPEPVRMFATFTQDLNELADWPSRSPDASKHPERQPETRILREAGCR